MSEQRVVAIALTGSHYATVCHFCGEYLNPHDGVDIVGRKPLHVCQKCALRVAIAFLAIYGPKGNRHQSSDRHRVCVDCSAVIQRSHKYWHSVDGRLRHRNCSDPESYQGPKKALVEDGL